MSVEWMAMFNSTLVSGHDCLHVVMSCQVASALVAAWLLVQEITWITWLLAGGVAGADLSKVRVQEITYQDGDTALLACDISNNNPGDRVSLLLWYKEDRSGGMGSPIYRIDARTNNHNIAIGETRRQGRVQSSFIIILPTQTLN